MIRVNLLPEKKRQTTSLTMPQLPWQKIGAGVLVLTLFYSGWLLLSNQLSQWKLRRLNAQWEAVRPESADWEEVHRRLEEMRAVGKTIQALTSPQAYWAPRLNLFSDSLVSGLWLTDMDFQQGAVPILHVQGSALVGRDNRVPAVNRYFQRIKDHSDFQRMFQSIELGEVAQREQSGKEIIQFSMRLEPRSRTE